MDAFTVTTTDRDFIRLVATARGEQNSDGFRSIMWTTSTYHMIVNKVYERSLKWDAENQKLYTRGSQNMDDNQKVWKTFFQDHSFNSQEEERNLADALSILTGIDMNKLMKPRVATRSQKFPPFTCVVPTGSSNGHSYRMNEPIMNFSTGTIFHKKTGEYGDNMSSIPSDYRVPSLDEVDFIVSALLYRIGGTAENFISSLL